MANSVCREMVRTLRSLGAVVRREGKHQLWALPSGATITVPRSPSDFRALLNFRSDVRRLAAARRKAAAR